MIAIARRREKAIAALVDQGLDSGEISTPGPSERAGQREPHQAQDWQAGQK